MLHDLAVSLSGPLYGSLADPAGSSVLVAAIAWLEGTVLGTIATTVAIIAVAAVGLMMLGGRVNLRHGATVVLGCFILFGASSIVAGIQSFVGGGDVTAIVYRPEPPVRALPPLPPRAVDADPYAGASLPNR